MPRPSHRCLLLLGLTLPATVVAQAPTENWSLRLPFATTGGAMATHPTTGRPVRFGGSRSGASSPQLPHLWEWDGSTWLRHSSAPGPTLRSGHTMATDTLRHQLVLFGGNTTERDTWTWDGGRWQAHPTPLLLAMRSDAAMAFDSARGRIVLFGGLGSTALGDTWEWDGSQWNLCNPGAPPAARYGHRMVFDAARGKTVLFGGGNTTYNLRNDTWEWDGTYWTQRFPSTVPAARQHHAIGFDPVRQRVVMFGGTSWLILTARTDTWEWDGVDWAPITPPHLPPGQARHALFFDGARQRLTMFGAAGGIDEVWEYDGVDWSPLVHGSAPQPRYAAAITDDPWRGQAVLFGGASSSSSHGDTWLWDGRRWLAPTTGPGPAARSGHALAFDASRGVAVLFGGTTYGSGAPPTVFHDDTWTWNGTTWTQSQPALRPTPRAGHGLAWHAPSSRLVLFGGGAFTTVLGETWTWDGSNWAQVATTTAPPGRTSAAMVGTGQDVLLFGGYARPTGSTFTTLGDTWTWNGAAWTQLQPAVSPSARYGAGCTYDADHGRALLFGGGNATPAVPGDTWAFDGSHWSPVTTATAPQARTGHVLVHDPRLHQVLLFGGGYPGQNDTWILAAAASESTFGAGCAGALGTPALQPSPQSLPEPGGTVVVEATNLPTSSAVIAMGFSNTTTGLQTLPLPLGAFGMPGCSLLVDPAATRLLLGTANAATWTLPLPFATGLFGIEFYCQAFAFDPPANAAGLTVSNATHTRVGT